MSVPQQDTDLPRDPLAFLRATHPFDELPEKAFALALRAMQIQFFEKGTRILQAGGEPSRFLYVIRKGSVRLERDGQTLLTLEEGEAFGYPSILAQATSFDAIADEDVLAYALPQDAFRALMQEPPFAGYFTMALQRRLERARNAQNVNTSLGVDFHQPLGLLVKGPAVAVPADESILEAARRMRTSRISSVLVEGSPQGILTDQDLRNRVLAEGRGPETRVGDVATFPLKTVPADTPVYEAWLTMLDLGINHLPVESGGRITGVLTGADLMRHHTHGPLLAFKRVEKLPGRFALAGYADDLARLVGVLSASGLVATQIARLTARINDALVRRILGWAEADLGNPPQPYAWIVFGSEGRLEQTLLTDQDNGLVWDRNSAADTPYFESLAEKVIADLLAAGFPRCPGGYMASRWKGPLAQWREWFEGWINEPRAEALLRASIFFDLRVVAGSLDASPLLEVLDTAGAQAPFMARLAQTALEFRPPLTLFRTIREEEGGIDVKRDGLMPIVGLARAYGLKAGSRATRTVSRLEAAAHAHLIGSGDAETLSEGYRFLLQLRLREQLRQRREGRPADNRIPVAGLSGIDRRHLKEVFSAVREAQEAAALHFHTAQL